MSFFGLTAFGPENFIRSLKVDSNGKNRQLYDFNFNLI